MTGRVDRGLATCRSDLPACGTLLPDPLMPIADKTLVTECCIGDGKLPVAAGPAAVPPTRTPPTISSLVMPEAPGMEASPEW